MTVGLEHYLVVSILLFALGLLGVIVRRNLLVIYMALELMLNAANLALVAFSRFTDNLDGQVFVFFIITVAAAEVAVIIDLEVLLQSLYVLAARTDPKRVTVALDQLHHLAALHASAIV